MGRCVDEFFLFWKFWFVNILLLFLRGRNCVAMVLCFLISRYEWFGREGGSFVKHGCLLADVVTD